MLVNVEDISPIKKKLSFEIPSDRVSREIEKVYGQIRKSAAIKGFRKGKVPQPIIEKYYSDKMESDVLKNLVNETYTKALVEKKIIPVSTPDFESGDLKPGESFSYTVTFETAPKIEVKDYTGLELEKRKYVPNPEVVDGRIGELREGMAQLKVVEEERTAVDGDFVMIDFKGFLNGVPFERGAAVDYMLQLGSKHFIPGFEEQVVGMAVGATKEVAVTFPAEYGVAELAGKPVTFEVTLKEIKAKELPPLDDDFAKLFGPYENMDELRERIGEVFEKEELQKIENELKDAAVKALIAKHEFDVPEAMVEKQQAALIENMRNNLKSRNLDFAKIGTSEETIRAQSLDVAVNQVKGSLLLAAVAEKEGITVEDSELESRIRDVAAEANKDFEEINAIYAANPYAKDTLHMQLREDKVIDFLLKNAEVKEVDALSEKP
ncbi:MAG: trigger factor [Geobacteraceae bacterium]|nr:trigger factor [Geobacteraceae bacterium]